MTEDRRPYLSSFQDRHDRTRWRYRRSGKTISIPGQPGEPDFEEAYQAAVEGRPRRKAVVVAHPRAPWCRNRSATHGSALCGLRSGSR